MSQRSADLAQCAQRYQDRRDFDKDWIDEGLWMFSIDLIGSNLAMKTLKNGICIKQHLSMIRNSALQIAKMTSPLSCFMVHTKNVTAVQICGDIMKYYSYVFQSYVFY